MNDKSVWIAAIPGIAAIWIAYIRNKKFVTNEELDALKSQLKAMRMDLIDCKKDRDDLRVEVNECKRVIETLRSENVALMTKLVFNNGVAKTNRKEKP